MKGYEVRNEVRGYVALRDKWNQDYNMDGECHFNHIVGDRLQIMMCLSYEEKVDERKYQQLEDELNTYLSVVMISEDFREEEIRTGRQAFPNHPFKDYITLVAEIVDRKSN